MKRPSLTTVREMRCYLDNFIVPDASRRAIKRDMSEIVDCEIQKAEHRLIMVQNMKEWTNECI